jgi:two-component system, OmpR family, sensor histidine kinase CiaH
VTGRLRQLLGRLAGDSPPADDAALVGRVRLRLMAWSGGTTLVVLLVLGFLLHLAVERSLATAGEKQLQDRAQSIHRFLAQSPDRRPPLGFLFGGGSAGTFAYVVSPRGQVFGPPELPQGLPDHASITAARSAGLDVRTGEIQDVPIRIHSETVDTNAGQLVIQVVQDRTAENRTLTVLLLVLLVGGGVALIVATAVGALYARRALVPIRQSLAGQQAALRRQREFAADASHELRTPLTVIRTSVEHLQRHRESRVFEVGSALDDIDAEVGHLTAIVEDLLLLARSDSGAIELERVALDLGDVAADAMPSLTHLASARNVEVVLDPEPAPVVGDPARLRQLVVILADNAVRHSPPGTTATVRVRRDGRVALLVVEDEGPGIRPEDLPHIFDRFWRAPGAPEGGTGLGLAIGDWIARRHGGSIAVEARQPHGTRFLVRLPLAGSPSSPVFNPVAPTSS